MRNFKNFHLILLKWKKRLKYRPLRGCLPRLCEWLWSTLRRKAYQPLHQQSLTANYLVSSRERSSIPREKYPEGEVLLVVVVGVMDLAAREREREVLLVVVVAVMDLATRDKKGSKVVVVFLRT